MRRMITDRTLEEKQDKLVSGQNIKTINGRSVLGSGNISIQGGNGGGNFAGKTLLVSGDSITERNFRSDTLWHDYLKDWFGLSEVKNDGRSGTGIVAYLSNSSGIIFRMEDWDTKYQDFDMILIMGNMNDASMDESTFPNGTKADAYSTVDEAKLSVYASLKYLCNTLTTRYPDKPIGFILSTPRASTRTTRTNGRCWGNFYDEGNELFFNEWCRIVKEVCGNYNIPVLDLYHESNLLRPWIAGNNQKYFSCDEAPEGDGVHPNALGHEVMAASIYQWMLDTMIPAFSAVDPGEDVPVSGMSLDKTNMYIAVNESALLTAIVEPDDATNKTVDWTVSPEGIVSLEPTVYNFGQTCAVKGLAVGNATITATTADGSFTSSCSVVVEGVETHELLDTFARADTTSGLGTAETGQTYKYYSSTTQPRIADGKAVGTASGLNFAYIDLGSQTMSGYIDVEDYDGENSVFLVVNANTSVTTYHGLEIKKDDNGDIMIGLRYYYGAGTSGYFTSVVDNDLGSNFRMYVSWNGTTLSATVGSHTLTADQSASGQKPTLQPIILS